MILPPFTERVDQLANRLRTGYEYIGHSLACPYLYFVYEPHEERLFQKHLHALPLGSPFSMHTIDLLDLAIESLRGQEERRKQLLEDSRHGQENAYAIVHVWVRETTRRIEAIYEAVSSDECPVIGLYNAAALHPVGNPSLFMEFLSEILPANSHTGRSAPLVMGIPGFYPPRSSRSYQFLSQNHPVLTFYAGENL